MFRSKWVEAVAVGSLAVVVLGCGAQYGTLPVEGRLTYDGQPLADMIVQFQPEEGRASQAGTKAAGSFAMVYTIDKMGVEPGKHKVTVSWSPPSDDDSVKPSELVQKVLDDFKTKGPIEVTIEEPQKKSEIKLREGAVEARYMAHTYRLTVAQPCSSFMEPWRAPNRNGLYRIAVFEAAANSLSYEASLT